MIRFLSWLGIVKNEDDDVVNSVAIEKAKIDMAVEALKAQARVMAQTIRETERMREVLRR